MNELTPDIIKTIEHWKNFPDLDPVLKKELEAMKKDELADAFCCDLEFGTGGMRGIIGPGPNRMNIYTLRRANCGYAEFIKKKGEKPSVVIGYDPRRNSLLFARESARVLCYHGIKIMLFNKITPTPELSFAVRFLKAAGGIMITASHNPAAYNGYKVYDETGCQLLPNRAEEVIEAGKKAPDPFTLPLLSYEEYLQEGMITIIESEIDDEYLRMVKSTAVHSDLDKSDFGIVFTPLHGTSAYLGERLLREENYRFFPVYEQMKADSEFSTVPLPNPEDPRAFTLSLKYARENNADICIATDPDADRLGAAVRDKDDYVVLNGNQIGVLLLHYLASFRKPKKKGVVINTIVTSGLGEAIAVRKGLECRKTLTGFKYIGEQMHLLEEDPEREFFFGYEESNGYTIKDFVRDKDSLQSLLLCVEMACYYHHRGKTLLDVLDEIGREYGYYREQTESIDLAGAAGALRMKRIMNFFREKELPFSVSVKEDYKIGVRFDYRTGEKTRLKLPESDVIKYYLNETDWFVLRPSGTEPKMKVYFSVSGIDKKAAEKKIKELRKQVLGLMEEIK